MDRFTYRSLNVAQVLAQAFPNANSGDDVVISIYDLEDNAMDVSQVSMTFETGVTWTYSWTPTDDSTFQIDFWNKTLDIHYYEYCKVTGTFLITPSGGLGSTTFENLKTNLLKRLDNYNANDTGTNSSDEIAGICINDALQLIYSQLKASRFLQGYGSTALASTADQAYIELSAISDVDEIVSLKDTTNDLSLLGISPERYFRERPNPANVTGTPYRYCRIFNRVYLDPRPTAVITYTAEYIKVYPRLSASSDTALIPNKFDDWIYKEASVIWYLMEDSHDVPASVIRERDDAREIYLSDALANTERTPQQSMSNFRRFTAGRVNPYDHV